MCLNSPTLPFLPCFITFCSTHSYTSYFYEIFATCNNSPKYHASTLFAIIIPAAQQTTDVVPDSGEIEMKRCDAYDVAGKCKLVKNQPVYEEVV